MVIWFIEMSRLIAALGVIIILGLVLYWLLYNTTNRARTEIKRNSNRLGISEEEYLKLVSSVSRKRNSRRISKSKRLEVFERDGWSCKVCSSKSNLVIDHIFPVSKGGGKEISNLQVLCDSCNSIKDNKVI